MITERRDLPQVEVLARTADAMAPAPVVRAEARRLIDEARDQLDAGPIDPGGLERELLRRLASRRPLRRVVNATGVLLHTNLGRAPLAPLPSGEDGLGAVPVEMDLEQGRRGRRLAALEADLCDLTGAEAALVVNNNAAGLLLTLTALAAGGEVVVSRGQLVEIGGSFRVPDIVVQGGALLREVGTTNRTHLADAAAIGEDTRVLLEVHPSNFAQVGFVTSPPTSEVAALAVEHGLVMVHDIGSGLVDAGTPWLRGEPPPWLRQEPAARQVLDAGAGVVTFSGDKLLGGPQAGIVCGDHAHLDRIRRHPLSRALRFDKLRAAQLHAVVRAHLDGSASTAIPFYRQALAPVEALAERAQHLAEALHPTGWPVEVVDVRDYAGGGAAAERAIPGVGLAIDCDTAAVTTALRQQELSVVATVRNDRLVLSMRTIDPVDDLVVAEALMRAASP